MRVMRGRRGCREAAKAGPVETEVAAKARNRSDCGGSKIVPVVATAAAIQADAKVSNRLRAAASVFVAAVDNDGHRPVIDQ